MKMDNILAGVKLALGVVAGVGASILCSAFGSSLTSNMKPIEKVCVGFASAVVGGIVADKATDYIDTKVDAAVNLVTVVKEAVSQAKNEQNEEVPENG